MNKQKQFFILLILSAFWFFPVSASSELFVSPGGANDGPCNSQAPCTYSRAEQLAQAGDTITFLPGVYGAINVGKDGLLLRGKDAIVDTTAQNGIRVARNNVTIRGFVVQRTWSHAVLVTGRNVIVEGVTIRESVRQNANVGSNDLISSCRGNTSWGSGIKAQLGAQDVVFRGNTVHNNCGEGIAVTRGINALVENNIVYDNFSVNIYIDNSTNVVAYKNKTWCHDPRFYRNNNPARGIMLGIENYSGWGNQMRDILIAENYIERCGGIRLYAESGYTLGPNVVIRDNLFHNVPTPYVNVPGAEVYNNVAYTTPTPTPDEPTATLTQEIVTLLPPTNTITPTWTPTFTSLPTWTNEPTPTPTWLPTSTQTPTSTPEPTQTQTQEPTPTDLCATFYWEDISITICRVKP